MEQEKIGTLIGECRRKKKMTQKELGNCLGVTDKSVSKWENGICLPDVSLYKPLCEILGITLNEFFAGERILEENYKEVADNNLLYALENSVFTLKEKVTYFDKKWEKEHAFLLITEMLLIVGFIIFGFVKNNGIQYLFMILGFWAGIFENNRKMAYIEKNVYGKKASISSEELKKSVCCIKEIKESLEKFSTKKEAVFYLIKETGNSKAECSDIYDFIMNLDINKMK